MTEEAAASRWAPCAARPCVCVSVRHTRSDTCVCVCVFQRVQPGGVAGDAQPDQQAGLPHPQSEDEGEPLLLPTSVLLPVAASHATPPVSSCLAVLPQRTDCKAVVSVLPGQILGPDGFQLSVGLSEVHLPRMWVERHPEKDSQVGAGLLFLRSRPGSPQHPPPPICPLQACMLVFYPDFQPGGGDPAPGEVVLLLDTSESMGGSLHTLQEIALRVLEALSPDVKVNLVLFGTGETDRVREAGGSGAVLVVLASNSSGNSSPLPVFPFRQTTGRRS